MVQPSSPSTRDYGKQDIHVQRRVNAVGALISVLLCALWTVLHGVNIYCLFWLDTPLALNLAVHVALTAIVACVTFFMNIAKRDIRHILALTISSAVASVFGAAGMLLTSVLDRSLRPRSTSAPFDSWYEALYPDSERSEEEIIYDNIMSGRDESALDYSVVSFPDAIALGTEAQKRRALTRMTDQFQPFFTRKQLDTFFEGEEFTPTFTKKEWKDFFKKGTLDAAFSAAYRRALCDENNAIRAQAAASIAKIEQQFTFAIIAANQLEAQYPDDAELTLDVARLHERYAFAGLLDDGRAHQHRQIALTKYSDYLKSTPNDIAARMEAARLLLRCKEYAQAITLLNDCIAAGFSDDTTNLWLLEALYANGDYAQLRQLAHKCQPLIADLRDNRPRLARSITAWAGGSA